jgi:hypothetical protein
MNKDDIRLNKAKRDAIKKAWRDTTLKTPTQKDTLLQNAVDTFRELEQSVWDNVINPVVTQNFPQDDMKILKKYSRNGSYGAFAQYDNCFYFKPSFEDRQETQYCWNYNRDDMTALYYNDLMSKGVNPNLYYEYENKDSNPQSDFEQLRAFNRSKTNMHNAQRDIFKEKIQLINDMNAVVDQSKFLSEVRKYWIDLDDCVNFDADEIGTAVSIISDDTKQRLLDSAKLRQAQRDIVAVVKTPKEKVLA